MIKAVIFDMDGLMIESEGLQSRAYETILRQYKVKPIYQQNGVIQTIGVREKDNWELIKKRHNFEERTEILMAKRNSVYLNLVKKVIKPRSGLRKLISLLKTHNLPLAVASSGAINHINLTLKSLKIEKDFEEIVSGQFVKRSKPYPDIFLETAKRLKIKPGNCLVLEDAENGVIAASNAGMKTIAVPNKFTKDQDFSKADFVFESLNKISWKIISHL